jgi:hypothetical protein
MATNEHGYVKELEMIEPGRKSRKSSAIVLVLALALGVLAVAFITGSATAAEDKSTSVVVPLVEQGCPANNVCTYAKQHFEGAREVLPCSDVNYHAVPAAQSARSRCNNKWTWITTIDYKCMPPGFDRPTPGNFSSVGFAGNYGEAVCSA